MLLIVYFRMNFVYLNDNTILYCKKIVLY